MPPRLAAALLLGLALLLTPDVSAGQGDSLADGTHVGLAAAGALTVHAGFASIQRGYHGLSAGTIVDFGHIASPRIRLIADVSYLLTFPQTEFVREEDKTYRDVFRDLSGTVALAFHANRPTSTLTPYVAAGVGVHVLSSSFGSLAIDTRYNTNNFGVLAAAGARLRLGEGRRRALFLETRRVMARNVGRTSLHLGATALLGELARR